MTTEFITVAREGTIQIITFNRPKVKNAINLEMYVRFAQILNEIAADDEITVTVLTGTGDFYSSGNDLKAEMNDYLLPAVHKFIEAFIRFPKLLIAIVNGPAVGAAVTTLSFCDVVFASENSYFYTPFTKLGVAPEGCSSFMLPRIIGERKATEMLLLNYKMPAKEALECGLVNYLYKNEELQTKVWDKIFEIAMYPKESILATKRLLKGSLQDKLLEVNEMEVEELNRMWRSESYKSNMRFFKENQLSKSKI